MSVKNTNQTEEKNINIKLNASLYNKVKILSSILSCKRGVNVQINELMNESMTLLLNHYQDVVQEELECMLDNTR